jgi:hypothetical protein
MARLGSFDIQAYGPTWFDVDNDMGGRFDRDLIPMPAAPPPPPPPPPRRVFGSPTGGWWPGLPPAELEAYVDQAIADTIFPAIAEEAAAVAECWRREIYPIAVEGEIRAVATGVARYHETSILLDAFDGRRFLYQPVANPVGRDRVVCEGELLGYTALPSMVATGALPAPSKIAKTALAIVGAAAIAVAVATHSFTPVSLSAVTAMHAQKRRVRKKEGKKAKKKKDTFQRYVMKETMMGSKEEGYHYFYLLECGHTVVRRGKAGLEWCRCEQCKEVAKKST